MSTPLAEAMNLPPVNQVGFVVKDLDQAIALYTPMFGDFTQMDAPDMEWDYRGSAEVSSLRLAFANSGDVEIELIEWVSGKTPHKEFLDAGREGMHHLRFIVDNLDQSVAEAAEHGYESIWQKRFGEGLAAAYLERAGDPLIIEFFENKAA